MHVTTRQDLVIVLYLDLVFTHFLSLGISSGKASPTITMPIGLQRINDRHPQPSSQIVFIKALPGPNQKYARDFLERIAAICHPIMKTNHLSIMTLEEHEANREFVGRNFNNGEIIQLVLKSQVSGQWLSFKTYVNQLCSSTCVLSSLFRYIQFLEKILVHII